MHGCSVARDEDNLHAERPEVLVGENGRDARYSPSVFCFLGHVRKNVEKYSALIIDADLPMILGDQFFSNSVEAGLLKETCVVCIPAPICYDGLAATIDSRKRRCVAADA